MAVLKDLIVHGPSRFINGAKFNTINAESIGASEGIFNKLVATTLDAREATIDNLTTTNAKVVGMLDVEGELHTNSWTNANIANIGGSFYISPTVEAVTGTISITRTETSGVVSWTVTASGKFATDFIKSGTSTTGVTWTANSLVLITGNITLNNLEYPLGTLKGTLKSPVTASAASTSKNITITKVVDAQNNTTVLQELYELNGNSNISGATFSNGKISLYQLGSFPIGIQMSSMGVNSNSIIDIYGGVKSTPTVRIGHLAGLPTINGTSPTGWGIYTDNGYFSGVIVSSSGKIGGYTIDATSLYSGTKGNSTTSGHFTLTTDTFTRSIDGTSRSNLQIALGSKFGVANDGTLYANGANITNINASNINTGYLNAERIEAGSLTLGQVNGLKKIMSDLEDSVYGVTTYVYEHQDISTSETISEVVYLDNSGTEPRYYYISNGVEYEVSESQLKTEVVEGQTQLVTVTTNITTDISTQMADFNDSINSELATLNRTVNNYLGADGYINLVTDGSEPCIIIGQGEFFVKITNTEMGFYQRPENTTSIEENVDGVTKVAWISSNELVISQSQIRDRQQIGDFIWEVRETTNGYKISLKHNKRTGENNE